MTDLTSAVLGQLDQSHVETIARQLGAQAQGAIQQALPMLMASLARKPAPNKAPRRCPAPSTPIMWASTSAA